MGEGASEDEIDQFEADPSPHEPFDRRAEQFLELEEALNTIEGSENDPLEGHTTGVVISAERVPVSSVPNSYPITTTGDEALALDIQVDTNRETTIFTDWPETITAKTPLVRLLSSLDLSVASFGDLYGEEVPLERVDHHYVLQIFQESADYPSWWVYGVLAGLISWIGIWLLPQNLDIGGLIIVTWVLLPIFTYFDIKYVSANGEWNPHQLLWPILMCIWILNIPVGLLYLYKRQRVTTHSR